MKKFSWGRVIDEFSYDFDGVKFDVTKYYATKYINGSSIRGEYEDIPCFHCQELSASDYNLFGLLVSWMAYKQLGLNQHALASGICRALEIK